MCPDGRVCAAALEPEAAPSAGASAPLRGGRSAQVETEAGAFQPRAWTVSACGLGSGRSSSPRKWVFRGHKGHFRVSVSAGPGPPGKLHVNFHQGQNDFTKLQNTGSISAENCASAASANNLKETFQSKDKRRNLPGFPSQSSAAATSHVPSTRHPVRPLS